MASTIPYSKTTISTAGLLLVVAIGISIGLHSCIPKKTTLETCRSAELPKITATLDSIVCQQESKNKKANPRHTKHEEITDDQCFCQLQGIIEDCSCMVDTVDHYNNFKVYPRMKSILAKDYFRYFQVNLKKECPFWADDSQCTLETCQVRQCKDDEVPYGLKGQQSRKRKYGPILPRPQKACENGEDLGYINTTLSEQSQEGFEKWKIYDDSLVDFCSLWEDEVDPDLQYVDLSLNPERYTGYRGPSAHRIWRSIYLENCFARSSTNNLMAPFNLENQQEDSCIEKRTFYRVISGLHASINIHLSAKYLLDGGNNQPFFKRKESTRWGHNISEFKSHFDGKLTQGQSPSWLKNLYFAYLVELKAISNLAPFLRTFNFYTGNPEEDADLSKAMSDLLNTVEQFPSHFEESVLFSRQDAFKLKSEFHQRFTNITKIMDCVGCQKCRLWGKLQIKGLGTALKILFSEPFSNKRIGDLTRNEIVALVNSFGKLSTSIYELDNFRDLIAKENLKQNTRAELKIERSVKYFSWNVNELTTS